MSGNTFGKIFTVSTFGESHGDALGCIIDGCPPGIAITISDIQADLDRRKPGQSDVTTPRKEDDHIEILSGIFEGKTTGTPIGLIIRNTNQRSQDYAHLKDIFRPNHADITYQAKYGVRDYRGGGRASARETAMRVAAGAVAKKFLISQGISTQCLVTQIGPIVANEISWDSKNKFNFADPSKLTELESLFENLIQDGDSVGAKLNIVVRGCPPGLGEPVFDKLDADLAKAIMSINAVKSVGIGELEDTYKRGSEIRDEMSSTGFKSNFSGGILGGISSSEEILIRFTIKPTSSIRKSVDTIKINGEDTQISVTGRHDPCVGIRAVPIAEAMTNLVIMDHFLRNRAQCADVDQALPFKRNE
ncbi:MAG: chorismate synthase [Gammaproteobacteria bacterium]